MRRAKAGGSPPCRTPPGISQNKLDNGHSEAESPNQAIRGIEGRGWAGGLTPTADARDAASPQSDSFVLSVSLSLRPTCSDRHRVVVARHWLDRVYNRGHAQQRVAQKGGTQN